MSVVLIPPSEANFYGPYRPHQEAEAAVNQERCVLELQEIVPSIPTTGDFEKLSGKRTWPKSHSRFSGRLLSFDKLDFGLLNHWLDRCKLLHGKKCSHSIWANTTPQQLKDLLVIDVERMCVVEAPPSCQYVTLSYCWGTTANLKHTRSNSEALKVVGALQQIVVPATIRDALQVIKRMGQKYLWVDAICIIQDDPVAQGIQLTQMGLIYSLATFTIIAASGDDADAGLPGVRTDTRSVNQELLNVGGILLVTVIDAPYYTGIEGSHWITRAWTMQEQIMSKRCLIFTEKQVYWRCWGAVWLEETVLENVSRPKMMHTPAKAGPADIDLGTVDKDYYGVYSLLVTTYLRRQLSFKSDLINAFSGITQAMSTIKEDSFHWGLPVSRFDWALTWRLIAPASRNNAISLMIGIDDTISQVPFPSWSWTAWADANPKQWVDWQGKTLMLRGEPEISFYSQSITGQLEQIQDCHKESDFATDEVQAWMETSGLMDLRQQWKGVQNIISNDLGSNSPRNITPGYLHFWTSSATLCIARLETDIGPRYEILMPFNDGKGAELPIDNRSASYHTKSALFMESTAHIPFKDPATMARMPRNALEYIRQYANGEMWDTSDAMIKEFVVIGRGGWHASPDPLQCSSNLACLIVEYDDGVAYRIGLATIDEKYWVGIESMEWKKIVLG
jgi:hypothetical protein